MFWLLMGKGLRAGGWYFWRGIRYGGWRLMKEGG